MQIKITNLSGKHLQILDSFNMIERSECSTLAAFENDKTYDVVLKDTVMIHTNCKVWLETHLHKYDLECTDFSEVIII